MSEAMKIFLNGTGAFVLATVMAPVCIPLLRKLKFGQTVRKEGPETHLA